MSAAASDKTNHQNEMPNSNKAKSMASVGSGQKLFETPLPSYPGPYSVGYMEIEVPVKDRRSLSGIRRVYKQLLNHETFHFFHLYYPYHSVSKQSPLFDGHRKSSRPIWFLHSRFEVGRSYARFAGLRKWPTITALRGRQCLRSYSL